MVFQLSHSKQLTNCGNRGGLKEFFVDWDPAESWVENNLQPESKLMIVFDAETEDFLTDLIVHNLDPINEALDLQPSLTFAEYGFKLLFKGLLSSSILDAYSSEVTTRLTLAEHHIYGSNHLGIQYYDPTRTDIASYRDFTNSANDNLGLSIKRPWYSHAYGDIIKSSQKNPWNNWERTVALSSERVLGMKEYSLTDHLGNVLVTVLDRKVGHQPVGATQYDYWMADIASAQDYYPYGMLMMNRYMTAGNKFRFGFNGIEKTNEVAGVGNHYTALFGEYDPRTIRRWNVDPKPVVWESPYAMFRGNPLVNSDQMLDSAWYRTKEGGFKFDARVNSQRDMKKLGINGTYIGQEAYGQTPGRNAMVLYGDRQGTLTVMLPEAVVTDKRNAWKAAHELGYMPAMGPTFEGIGLRANVGAGGGFVGGGVNGSVYADNSGNLGAMAGTGGGFGTSTPGLEGSFGVDLYDYKRTVSPEEFAQGTSVSSSLQLGILSFTRTSSSNAKSPFRPDGNLNIFSIDLGLKGFGYTTKIGLTKYAGVNVSDK